MLAAKDTPMVETLRFADEVPFADHGSLVSGLLKEFGECLLIAVECTCIIGKTIFVTELAGEDASARRSRKSIDSVTIIKANTFIGNPIHIRSLDQISSITGHCLSGVIIRHHEDDVWLSDFFFLLAVARNEA